MEGIGRLEFRTWGSTYIIFLFARGGCKMKTLKSNLPKYRVGNFKKTQKFSKKRKRSNYWSQCIKKARFWWCFSIAYRIREKQIWGKKYSISLRVKSIKFPWTLPFTLLNSINKRFASLLYVLGQKCPFNINYTFIPFSLCGPFITCPFTLYF